MLFRIYIGIKCNIWINRWIVRGDNSRGRLDMAKSRCCATMNINRGITRRVAIVLAKINLSARREMDHFSRHLTLGVTCSVRRCRYLRSTWEEYTTCDAVLAPSCILLTACCLHFHYITCYIKSSDNLSRGVGASYVKILDHLFIFLFLEIS